MTIEKDKVVALHYTLRDDSGKVVDTSVGSAPLEYLQGRGMLLPKFEEALEGKSEGDGFKLDLSAKDGYGEYDETLVTDVLRGDFETDAQIEVGMKFQAMTEQGPAIVVVKKVTADTITVDANHELAGKDLHFDIEVISVRDATEDERFSGRVGGGCGGCGGGNCGGSGCKDDCGGGDDCSCEGGCCSR